MNLQVKSSLILIGTLILGVVLGALGSSALMRSRFEHLREIARPHRMAERILHEIGPLEPDQQDVVTKIFDETEHRVHDEMELGRERIHEVFDSTMIQLEAVLTPAQMAKVKDIMGREHEFRPGPPPGRPGMMDHP